ncbi:transglutaminase domain-containing protein [Schumannella luteola]|uniref:Transglutaminase-like putative cysteine protease n=1 Tax=Schumannella luteola TaxID=472059 RepID=A0A852YIK9_9MICO|nr:DUF3488 and transglutaminase-like domain-containing protein [Schumannella luteola]NYG98948.1 transglutaminase-like putative cysteine protease [Schumannella luteola]TPX06320.1 transglutaminase domain-containing protein [Schumannella luteola]
MPGTRTWPDSLLALLALAVALAALNPLLSGVGWWFAGAFFAAVVIGAAGLARFLMRSTVLPPLIGLAAGLVAVELVFLRGQAIAGVVPTPAVFRKAGELAEQGTQSIAQQAVPAEPVPGILFLIVLGVVGLAFAADLLVVATQVRALAALPMLALLMIPMLVLSGRSDALVWIAACVVYLILLRRGARPTSRLATWAVAALVVAGSLVIPSFLPPVGQTSATQGGLETRVNPLVSLGEDLRRGTAVTALRYSTKSTEPLYLRLATYESFSGETWAPTVPDKQSLRRLDSLPSAVGRSDDVPTGSGAVDVRVDRVGGRWAPVPYAATRIRGLDGDWRADADSLTVRSGDGEINGRQYTVDFDYPTVTPEQLDEGSGTGRYDFDVRPYLETPSTLDPVIADTAAQVTAGKTTAWEQAVALQDWFRDDFSYSEEAPVDDDYDGSGVGVMPKFLEAKAGYCVHFASTMTVMARTLGIPARMVVGFLPGDLTSTDDDDTANFRVDTHKLHAWPELYFEGYGWLRFEPTPSRGSVPAYAIVPGASGDDTEPSAAPSDTPSDAASDPANRPDRTDTPAQSAAQDAARSAQSVAQVGGIVLGVVLVLLIPLLVRRAVRLRRFSRIRRGRDPAQAAWTELRDTARDHGWNALESESVETLTSRLVDGMPDGEAEKLRRLARSVERTAYAPPNRPPVTTDDLSAAIRAIERDTPPVLRVRGALLPGSLFRRVLAAADA